MGDAAIKAMCITAPSHRVVAAGARVVGAVESTTACPLIPRACRAERLTR